MSAPLTLEDLRSQIDPCWNRIGVRGDKSCVLAPASTLEALSEPELFEFLLLPGFTLAEAVTEISGRGVGLDVVRELLKQVRGKVRIASEPGRGTRFQLQLPLTLSVVRSLLFEVGGEPFALPLASIVRTLKIRPEMLALLEGRPHFDLHGRRIGLLAAHQVLEAGDPPTSAATELSVIVIGDEECAYGLLVDRLLGERELVVHLLDPRLGKIQDISAASLMEDMARAVHTFKANELAREQLEAQIATGAQQIAATAREQQASASEVAATVTEIGATSKEISATSRELLRTVGEVAHVAEQSATLAGNGQAGLTHMETTMRNVMEAAGAINAKLAVLNEKAGNINQVVVTITKVADQTNLLSLNAAIEAEKAGEYGRGFSVVATEIRRLADQTAVATYDIEQMVKEIQSAVAAGVMGMDKFSEEVRRGMHEVQQVGAQLSQIIQQVQTLAPRIETVNEGMQAQATGAEQITQALTQLNEATQQTMESLRQSADAIDELNKVSSGLRHGLTQASALKRQDKGGDGSELVERRPAASSTLLSSAL